MVHGLSNLGEGRCRTMFDLFPHHPEHEVTIGGCHSVTTAVVEHGSLALVPGPAIPLEDRSACEVSEVDDTSDPVEPRWYELRGEALDASLSESTPYSNFEF